MNHKLNEDEHAVLSDLQRGGIPLDEDVLERIRAASPGLSIYQTGTLLETSVFDLNSGGSGPCLAKRSATIRTDLVGYTGFGWKCSGTTQNSVG